MGDKKFTFKKRESPQSPIPTATIDDDSFDEETQSVPNSGVVPRDKKPAVSTDLDAEYFSLGRILSFTRSLKADAPNNNPKQKNKRSSPKTNDNDVKKGTTTNDDDAKSKVPSFLETNGHDTTSRNDQISSLNSTGTPGKKSEEKESEQDLFAFKLNEKLSDSTISPPPNQIQRRRTSGFFSLDPPSINPLPRKSIVRRFSILQPKPMSVTESVKGPPKLADRTYEYYLTENKEVRRKYTNRFERFFMGPISCVVEAIGTFVLGAINFSMLGIACGMMYAGVVILTKRYPYDEYMTPIKKEIENKIADLNANITTDLDDMEKWFEKAGLPFIFSGIGLAIFSLVGLFGVFLGMESMLSVYTKICGMVLLLEFCLFLYIYDGEPNFAKYQLLVSIDNYSGIEGTNRQTNTWNLIMNYFNCCGVNNYEDFHWRNNWPPPFINGTAYDLLTPVACCKNITGLHNFTCASKGFANELNNNMYTGCYLVMYNFLFMNNYVIAVFMSLLIFQFTVLFFSIWLRWTLSIRVEDMEIINIVKNQILPDDPSHAVSNY